MAIKTTWTSTDISNRLIVEDLMVKYSTEEVNYDVAAKGDPSQAPQYVTTAEAAVQTASTNLATATATRDALDASITSAENAKDGAYAAWYAAKTNQNYAAYITAKMHLSTVLSQYADANTIVSQRTQQYNAALKTLNAANERWAGERQSVYYKGGRKVGFIYHRFATLRMKYVGFSFSAATACRNALDAFYTRVITKTASFDDGIISELTQTLNPSSVKAVKTDGNNYSVEIDINEEDVHASTKLVTPSSLFTTENARNYFIEQEAVA